ncbi:hypothetical protein AAFF_G00151090 [Aldrovandia affinis]|uniref:Endoplasmic reticulum transmembrane protein n=1 Tax=Aldrovandia affinis TaxID=143900 RepID=A0AAD7RPB3_9TELE|nr:hypothetical protein AAFF_G00151090 [Aldrovandia affinis]
MSTAFILEQNHTQAIKQTCASKMTLQWTAVALFLYAEIGVILILSLPFISAQRWQKIFKLSIWNRVAPFWNKGFLTMIIILIVLFLDAVREVRKYSRADPQKDDKLHPNMFDHLHMKLFRAQRNLYISGFSLFLWLVMRRVITLINQLAASKGTGAALQTQAESANQAANKYMEDNEHLKQALELQKVERKNAEGEVVAQKEGLQKEVQRLKQELESGEHALKKSRTEVEAMRRQAQGLTQEYDRLLKEHQQLQNLLQGSGDKKDQ